MLLESGDWVKGRESVALVPEAMLVCVHVALESDEFGRMFRFGSIASFLTTVALVFHISKTPSAISQKCS